MSRARAHASLFGLVILLVGGSVRADEPDASVSRESQGLEKPNPEPHLRETRPSDPEEDDEDEEDDQRPRRKPRARPRRLPPATHSVRDARREARPENVPAPTLEQSVSDFIEGLPGSVQDTATNVAESMTASRRPPNRFLYSIFGLPRGRFGTGTSWLPDESPLIAAVPHFGNWGLMLHGSVYAGYDYYSSERGGRRFFGRNTLMGALFRTFEHSEWLFRAALSLEPLTIGKRGYPQVLQSGQTADGEVIHDRMYALDFFRELAATYSWEVTPEWGAMFYAALAGEPAVGPVTFTQRISASPDPLAPLGFVAQETSHASFGVLTVGAFTRKLKLEASWFNGELPGEHRYTVAIRRPDSYSGRISWNPYPWLSAQVSYAFLGSPSARDLGRSDHRLSTSVAYTRWRANDSGLAATMSFAERFNNRGDVNTSLMLEGYWNIDGKNAVFGRWDLLQKSGNELALPVPTKELFAIGSFGAGYIYYLGRFITLTPGLGIRGSINLMEDDLGRFYGGQAAYGLMVYLQLRTAAMPIGI